MQTNEKVTKMIIAQGIFAVLFVGLLTYTVKTTTYRERFLQDTLTNRLEYLDVINEKLEKLDQDNAEIKNLIVSERKNRGR